MNDNPRRTIRTLARVGLVAALFALALPAAAGADDLRDGRTALAAGQLDAAAAAFEKAAAQGFAEGRAGVGQVLLRRRQYDRALEAFEAAEKMDANLAMAHYGQGEALRQLGRCADAIPFLKRATELDRKFPEAQLALGECHIELNQHDPAVAALNEGLKWGPKWRPRFLVALGNAELARDSLRDAGIFFTTARQEAPSDPQPRRALGNFYLKRGIPSLAIPEYQAAAAMDTADVELRFGLAQALYFDQRYNDALEEYRWVVQRDPDFAPGQLALGNLYYLSGPNDPRRYEDALPNLERYTTMRPADARGWSLLGRNRYFLSLRKKEEGLRDQAIAALEKAVELGDKSKEMHTVLGRAYVDKREWQKALDAYGRGEPNTTDMLKIGQIFAFLNQPASAESVYTSMVDRDSTSSEAKFALIELGKLRFRQKDYPGAVSVLERRIALDPNTDEAFYYTGLSYKEMKQIPEAIVALRHAADLGPNKADRHFWLGLVLAQADSIPEAIGALVRSVEIDSTSRNAAIAYQQLGYRALLAKDWSDAAWYLDRSGTVYDKDFQTWVWLGQAYQNMGNRERAVGSYRKALQLKPDQADAAKGLKSLSQ